MEQSLYIVSKTSGKQQHLYYSVLYIFNIIIMFLMLQPNKGHSWCDSVDSPRWKWRQSTKLFGESGHSITDCKFVYDQQIHYECDRIYIFYEYLIYGLFSFLKIQNGQQICLYLKKENLGSTSKGTITLVMEVIYNKVRIKLNMFRLVRKVIMFHII